MSEGKKTAAVFIDADNCPLVALPFIFECLEPEWNVTVRRAYGVGLAQHRSELGATGTMPIEVVPHVKRKNATDMVLALDVMEHLYRGNTDCIVLVSGDSDFTQLVLKVRESGKPILVFGYASASLVLQKACTTFHVISGRKGIKAQTVPTAPKPAVLMKPGPLTPELQRVKESLERSFVELAGEHGDTTIARFGGFLREKDPTFNLKKFGTRSLRSLLRRLGGFELCPIRNADQEIINYGIALVTPPHVEDAEQPLAAAEGKSNAGT